MAARLTAAERKRKSEIETAFGSGPKYTQFAREWKAACKLVRKGIGLEDNSKIEL